MRPSSITADTAADATASHQIVGASSNRVRLKIYPPEASFAAVNTRALADSSDGIVLSAGGMPLVLDLAEDGDIVQQPWLARGNAAGAFVAWIETFA